MQVDVCRQRPEMFGLLAGKKLLLKCFQEDPIKPKSLLKQCQKSD